MRIFVYGGRMMNADGKDGIEYVTCSSGLMIPYIRKEKIERSEY